MTWEELKLELSAEVKQLLEDRHIAEDEIKLVINNAETKGEKLYQPDENRYLAKLRIGQATFYVEYSIGEDQYVVSSAYAHKAEIKE